MKTVLILFILIISSSYALGETYRWEDADTMYFTDNPESIPEKYREKAIEGSREEIQTPKTEAIEPPALESNQTIKYKQAFSARSVVIPAQVPIYPLINSLTPRNIKEDFEPVSKFISFVILFSASLAIGWIIILADIFRSEFTPTSSKAHWIVLVLFMPPVGMLFYVLSGFEQKISRFCYFEKGLNHV